MILHCGKRSLDLSQPKIMGILNVTPDSFSDGGQFYTLDDALARARKMVTDGASIIDIGGESTRPGSVSVSTAEQLDRTIPVIEKLRSELDIVISIDTSDPQVMKAALNAGVDMINDVLALQQPGALDVVVHSQAAICLMHMQGQPRTMQRQPTYSDVITEVRQFFIKRIQACKQAEIASNRLLVDPGFGFGKTLEHNYELLAKLNQLSLDDHPILVGISRKSMIGDLLVRPLPERVVGSVTGALLAAQQGAHILRVHDVAQTHDALSVWHKVLTYQ